MPEIQIFPIPYQADSTELFAKIAHLPCAVFLDSCPHYEQIGRYDILAAKPRVLLKTIGSKTLIQSTERKTLSTADPFSLVKEFVDAPVSCEPDLPFVGGAIGYFSYDLNQRLNGITARRNDDINLPHMVVGIYDWALLVDHLLQETKLIVYNLDTVSADLVSRIRGLFEKPSIANHAAFKLSSELHRNFSKSDYAAAFMKIKEYLSAGDCYQINLTQRFSASYTGSPWNLYQNLRKQNPAPFSAFLNFMPFTILSLSPERFLYAHQNQVETKPIKGTRPRNLHDVEQDQLAKNALLNDPKDRAENLMIVDLLRNDLSKSCQLGSVKVPKLFALESFPAVHHLVSTVTGQLNENLHSLDLLRGCFPGGSITGTPKHRAMQIIEELENYRRGIYCGAIGYMSYNNNMDTNIAIRTLLSTRDQIFCYAGGAITADSELEAEYQECFDKLAVILKVLETK